MTIDVSGSGAFPPAVSAAAILASLLLILPGVVVCFLRARARAVLAAAAEASVGTGTPMLVEGANVVLSGIVRHLDDHDVAVKVVISQEGSEAESSGSWSHSWVEIDRDIIVAPFLLELANGELVRIDPPRNVEVADDLDQKVWINRNKRVLSAELVPGEQIFARGRLARSDRAAPSSAYRDVTWGWALGPADGQMLLSSEPLGAGLRARARFHRGYAWFAIVILLATQLTLVWFYTRLLGDTTAAKVASKRHYQTTDSDGDRHDHHVIELAPAVGAGLVNSKVDLDEVEYDQLVEGDMVAVRRASASNWNLGSGPTLRIWHSLLLLLPPLLFWVIYKSFRVGSRPWFRRKVAETRPGRLPESG